MLSSSTPKGPNRDSLSSSFSRRSSKIRFRSSTESQPTLTQIDFIARTQDLNYEDSELEYIEESGHHHEEQEEVIAIVDDSQDVNEGSPPNQRRHARSVRFEQHDFDDDLDDSFSKRRRVYHGTNGASRFKKNNPKARDQKNMKKKTGSRGSAGEKTKTLTQMHFVQRFIPIESDDFDYAYIAPRVQDHATQRAPGKENQCSLTTWNENFDVRQNLSEVDRFDESNTTIREKLELSSSPPTVQLTPQKTCKLEIPSSQSPEHPTFFLDSIRQIFSSPSSPLKHHSAPPAGCGASPIRPPGKQNPQNSERELIEAVSGQGRFSARRNLAGKYPNESKFVNFPQKATWARELHASKDMAVYDAETGHAPLKTQKTVIYETDADTEDGHSEEEFGSIAGIDRGSTTVDENCTLAKDDIDELEEDSQGLLPPHHLKFDLESTLTASSSKTFPSSEASICYRRLQPATQFPSEPVPVLNSQKMSELFPSEKTPRKARHERFPLPPLPSHKLLIVSPTGTRTLQQAETNTRTETLQSQESDHLATEVVPESSPILKPAKIAYASRSAICPQRASVVQVESSQPSDKLISRMNSDQSSAGARGILSKSQLLTPSLMESVPLVPFWVGSQDSIGELYSMPDS